MNTIDYFRIIYSLPNTVHEDSVSIDEEKVDAKIHHLIIIGEKVQFTKFNESFSKQIGNLFSSRTYCKKNADGIIFFQKNNKNHLLICELKSSHLGVCDTAFEQAASTYIKTVMVFSICEGFSLMDTDVVFIFTTKEDGDMLLKLNELLESDQDSLSPMEKKRLSLLKDKRTTIRLPDIPNRRDAFCKKIQEKEIKCLLVSSSESDSITLSIDDIA